MKSGKINRKNKKTEKKMRRRFRRVVSGPGKRLAGEKNGPGRTKCPLFSVFELLFQKNVISFAMTFFSF